MSDIKTTDEVKKIAKEYLEGCPYLRNIKKEQTEWTKRWDNFCPRGDSVSYFVPDNEDINNDK